MRPLLILGSALVLLFATAACDSKEENVCEARCDCEGCSGRDYDNCLYNYDNDARAAEVRGCGGYYDDWVACQEATWYCDRDFDFHTDCGPERSRLNSCLG